MIVDQGMYDVGLVTQLDPDNARARVQFKDRDNMTSWWLQIVNHKSEADKGWWFPDVGDQVICLMDRNYEDGKIIGTVYSTPNPPPGANAPSPLKLTLDGSPSSTGNPIPTGTFDQMFTQAAATCPALSTAVPGVSAKNVLKGLATSESSLNPSAISQPGVDGSRCYGMMQISVAAHGQTPDYWLNNTGANIQAGADDLCGKISTYGDFKTALGHYKGWTGTYGSTMSSTGVGQVNSAIADMQALGMS